MISPLLSSMRPRQWVKNLFVAAPLVFSKHLSDPDVDVRAALAFIIFCGLSSAVYLWNDTVDIEKDRAHPIKCKRPIAAGLVSVKLARVTAAILAVSGLVFGSFLSIGFVGAALGYLILNLNYSLWLKRVVYVDVLSISAGFLLRVLGGAFAIDVWTSPYLLICTALLACFLGFGKRAHELNAGGARAAVQRPVLRGYRGDILRWALYVTGATTLASYVLYTQAAHTLAFFHTTKMVWTTPFAAYGLWRFLMLVGSDPKADSPTEEMLKDWRFIANLSVWAVAIMGIIYFRP